MPKGYELKPYTATTVIQLEVGIHAKEQKHPKQSKSK
jgi:hypothetical protein